jgi:hypothetical protein
MRGIYTLTRYARDFNDLQLRNMRGDVTIRDIPVRTGSICMASTL